MSEAPLKKPTRRTAILLAAGVAVFALLLDQIVKIWVETTMTRADEFEVIPGLVYWRYHLNPGAAFSMGTEYTWVFTIIQATVLTFAVIYALRLGGSWLWALGLGGLAGGVAGNLTDRLFRAPSLVDGSFEQFGQGHVVDMIAVPNFAVFNVADSFIVCSIIGLCAMMLFGLNIDGTRESQKKTKSSDDDSEEVTQ